MISMQLIAHSEKACVNAGNARISDIVRLSKNSMPRSSLPSIKWSSNLKSNEKTPLCLPAFYKSALQSITDFTAQAGGLRLRTYQQDAANAILDSVINRRGLSFVVLFPRQSGKNELQAQIETYLLVLHYRSCSPEMVKISPTWKPQSLNAMRRLERVLSHNFFTCSLWFKESGYIYGYHEARIFFFSGSPTANIVGATASLLLEVDEAQDITIEKWDKEIAPMAASTNATRVFWGTAWTSRTLLARELRSAQAAQEQDGIQRVFRISADEVRKEVPAYGKYVDEQVSRLGRNHPLVKTQYFSEEIDSEIGMFPPHRLSLMVGTHPLRVAPQPANLYAATIDIAGEDESILDGDFSKSSHDSTALTIFEVDLATSNDILLTSPTLSHTPTYRVVNRYTWTGIKHAILYPVLRGILDLWQPRYIVVDATGIGQTIYSLLENAYPYQVIPFIFTAKSKSDLAWNFLSIIETGRYKDLPPATSPLFWQQLESCQSKILEGPGRMIRWGVPDGTRSIETGELIHDDLVISAALCSVLDQQTWGLACSQVIQSRDPIQEMRKTF